MTLTTWAPARDIAGIEIERLNRMFDGIFRGEASERGTWSPAVDVFDAGDNGIVFKAELPGMKRDDIKVTVENNVLAIEGERTLAADTPREQFHRLERRYGAFRRTFALPSTVDAARVQAGYADGVLTVSVPQRPEAKPRQIVVEG